MKNYERDLDALNVPWVFSPFFDTLLEKASLTAQRREAVRSFRDQGYLILEDPVVEMATIERAVQDLDGHYDEAATGYHDPSRKHDAWRFSEAVARIAWAPSVIDTLELLYGRRAFPFQTLNFRVGTEQRAHSDSLHFHSIPQRFMVGVWVALEDIAPGSGPLQVYPGSHRLHVFEPFDLALESSYECYREYEDAIEAIAHAEGLGPKRLLLQRGQAIIWAANLLHGGTPVDDPESTRLSQATHYFFDDCVYYRPGASELFMGRLTLMDVREVGTGRTVPNLYRGRPVEEWLDGGREAKPRGLMARLIRGRR